jgi:hypothetical protein
MRAGRWLDWIPWPWRKWRVVVTVEAADEIPRRLPKHGAALVLRAGRPTWIAFECPCKRGHQIMVNLDKARSPKWELTNRSPLTLAPSINDAAGGRRCHFFVRKGRIRWVYD